MHETREKKESPSTTLCKACGLCCTGHLFMTAKLYPAEVEQTGALGLNVLQSDSDKPAFSLGCPLWNGQCTIYSHPAKPSICGDFKCKLLRELEAEQLQLEDALKVVQRTRTLIQELDGQISTGQTKNFRRYLFDHLNQLERDTVHTEKDDAFRLKAGVLLVLFAQRFGVTGLFNMPEQEKPAQEKPGGSI